MLDQINNIFSEATKFNASNLEECEKFRITYLGKKGILNQLFEDFKTLSSEDKKNVGQKLNELKNFLNQAYNNSKELLKSTVISKEKPDLSMPGDPFELGSRHPVSVVLNDIKEIFSRIGFTVSNGPDIEDDWHVFQLLIFH